MVLDNINLNYLRIFESVYRTRSMTQAAQELHLTQSGISQHIKSLEESLDLKLFDRIKQKLIPTQQGDDLYGSISPQLKSLEQALLSVTAKDHLLRGNITIGMPVVFGLNVVIPILSDWGKEHPELNFSVRFELAHTVNNLLLTGEVDFALVDDFPMDAQVKTNKVYDETLLMCCSQKYMKKISKDRPIQATKKFFENVDFIAYERGEPVLRKWLQYHVKGGQANLKVKAHLADALGVSRFINSDFGFGVLPKHHVDKLLNQGDKLFVVDTKNKELKNKISVSYVESRSRTLAIQETLEFVTQRLKSN